MEIIKILNKEQQEAVLTTEGPLLVIAGAGSGKTRLLTHRVAYLIREKKVSPRNVLAVTFTNKAAEEMKERVKKLLGAAFSLQPWLGTFHHVCVRILRVEIERLGFGKSFVIYDDADQLSLIKKIFRDMQISEEQFNPKAVRAVISKAKGELQSVEDFVSGESRFERVMAKVYEAYQKSLRDNNALDFDDILQKTVELFRKFPDILQKYQNIFRYILIDEYQDTNHAQYVLANLLSERHRNLCVVGDDWQSVYAFRGADVRNILNFERDYPEAKVIKLEQNYRSTQKILDAAHGVVSKNVRRKDKRLWTENKAGHDINIYKATDERDEADFIVSEIGRLAEKEKSDFRDFVVLYRTNAQSRAIEESFLEAAIPYRVVGGVRFYERREIKDFLAYLRLTVNPNDEISLGRVINLPVRGIGKVTFSRLVEFARNGKMDLIEAAAKAKYIDGLAAPKIDALARFGATMERLRDQADRVGIIDFMESILVETGYQKMLLSEGETGQMRFENVRELFTVAEKYKKEKGLMGAGMLLEETALVASTDNIDSKSGAVHLMTLHSAKGLEFETVFIAGMEEGLFPHSRALLDASELEEERRLCYVGITRAKKKVYLLWAQSRNIFGSTRINVASRFLDDIPPSLVRNFDRFDARNFAKDSEAKDAEKASTVFKDGQRVKHPDFGEGVVISAEKGIITVAFMKSGIKKIAGKYGKIKRL